VNCVAWEEDRLVGHSTDGAGFLAALEGFDPAGERCAVVGAGGAGRAVAQALGRAGASEVVVINRSADRRARAVVLAGPAVRSGARGIAAAATGSFGAALVLALFQSYLYAPGNAATLTAWVCAFAVSGAAAVRS